jgi:quercetin dioxygenase-like cupin family protein|tara:strand:+ start:81 stop:314 length:234 start_codon:yes stop_codon:yes gene_type:complete
MTNIIPELIKQNWNSRGYSFGVFRDPPGQVWADFVHRTDELVVLAEGEIEVEVEGKAERFQIGGMVFIPAKEIWKII